MPNQVIRNGKTYLEYSPQELAAAKLDREIEQMKKHGFKSYTVSYFTSPVTTNPDHIKKRHGL